MRIASISTGFLEVPGQASTNIFVQGCSIKCPGCHTPLLQDPSGGEEVTQKEFEEIFQNGRSFIKWVCWLGGEPSDQAKECIKLNKKLKKLGYFIALYSGKELSELPDKLLLDIDLVKAGSWKGKVVSDEESNQAFFIKNKFLGMEFGLLQYSEVEDKISKYMKEVKNVT